ncbi:MAG: hypothetical protein ACTHKQ_25645 [Mesorhizobium sp.]
MTADEAFKAFNMVGGPAFPSEWKFPDGGSATCPGMTLRDWFAGQALFVAKDVCISRQSTTESDVARVAYDIADAMLKAREGGA